MHGKPPKVPADPQRTVIHWGNQCLLHVFCGPPSCQVPQRRPQGLAPPRWSAWRGSTYREGSSVLINLEASIRSKHIWWNKNDRRLTTAERRRGKSSESWGNRTTPRHVVPSRGPSTPRAPASCSLRTSFQTRMAVLKGTESQVTSCGATSILSAASGPPCVEVPTQIPSPRASSPSWSLVSPSNSWPRTSVPQAWI